MENEQTLSAMRADFQLALGGLSKAVFSEPIDKLCSPKLIIRPITVKGALSYQTESFKDNKAFHQNMSGDELLKYFSREIDGRYRQGLILSDKINAQYSLKTNGKYKRREQNPLPRPIASAGHNREKNYILSQGENIPALVDLGVFTQDFRVVEAKFDKFKQINRFIEIIDDVISKAGEKELTILDFGCGKSYLTFILYYYLTEKRGLKAKIIGYDIKADVVEHCNALAEKYGYENLRFVVADVTKDKLYDEKIDMVISLHACDTATDYALNYAVTKGAKYIFSVPCCQHEINSSIKKGGEFDCLLKYGIIKERFSALLTDAFRAGILDDLGYKVDMLEFVDFDHSPKNIMIRAVKGKKISHTNRDNFKAIADKYGFEQTLLKLTDTR